MIKIESLENIQRAAKEFLSEFKNDKIFAFVGEMGSGKTTFIKALCTEQKVEDNISSPTFSIVNEYSKSDNSLIYHFDMYRIKDLKEALDFGLEEYLYSNNLCYIEWPEVVSQALPEETVFIEISVKDDGSREITRMK